MGTFAVAKQSGPLSMAEVDNGPSQLTPSYWLTTPHFAAHF